MPQWLHDRAKHIMAKNPSMPESEAFAIATQQSHATGHTPKSYGTSEGKHEAKKKYDTPKDDKQTADPGGIGKEASLLSPWIDGFTDELAKIAMTGEEAVAKGATDPAHMYHLNSLKKSLGYTVAAKGTAAAPFHASAFRSGLFGSAAKLKLANISPSSPATVGDIKMLTPKTLPKATTAVHGTNAVPKNVSAGSTSTATPGGGAAGPSALSVSPPALRSNRS